MKFFLPMLVGSLVAGTALAGDYLNPEQIRDLFVGKKVVAQAGSGPLFDFQMNADNTATTSAAGGDNGVWRFSQDGYCVTWTRVIRVGQERCFKVSRAGLSHFVIAPDGGRTRVVRIDALDPAATPQRAVAPARASVPAPVAAPVASPAASAASSVPAAPAAPVVPAAAVAAPSMPAAPIQPAQPGAEQRLKQAKELLDKNLINQQQYDEFVSRIMKEM